MANALKRGFIALPCASYSLVLSIEYPVIMVTIILFNLQYYILARQALRNRCRSIALQPIDSDLVAYNSELFNSRLGYFMVIQPTNNYKAKISINYL